MKQKGPSLHYRDGKRDTIMRDARYIEIPGSRTHELPPLLVHAAAEHAPVEDMESVLGEAEDMLAVATPRPTSSNSAASSWRCN